MEKTQVDISAMSFEEALRELESIVRQLEEGRATLEEAIAFYERGSVLKTFCEAKLRDAQMRVDQIMVKNNGEITLQPFQPSQDEG